MFEDRLNEVNKNDENKNKKVPEEVRQLPFTQPNIQLPRPPVPSPSSQSSKSSKTQKTQKTKIKEIIPETDEFKEDL